MITRLKMNSNNLNNKENLDFLIEEFKRWYKTAKKFGCRAPNFPEYISENIVKYYIINNEKLDCINAKTGDLYKVKENKKI